MRFQVSKSHILVGMYLQIDVPKYTPTLARDQLPRLLVASRFAASTLCYSILVGELQSVAHVNVLNQQTSFRAALSRGDEEAKNHCAVISAPSP